jgi:hypothetical protein
MVHLQKRLEDKTGNFWLKGFKEPIFATFARDPHGIAQSAF